MWTELWEIDKLAIGLTSTIAEQKTKKSCKEFNFAVENWDFALTIYSPDFKLAKSVERFNLVEAPKVLLWGKNKN